MAQEPGTDGFKYPGLQIRAGYLTDKIAMVPAIPAKFVALGLELEMSMSRCFSLFFLLSWFGAIFDTHVTW